MVQTRQQLRLKKKRNATDLKLSFLLSFGKTKRNVTEAESTWPRQHKRLKRSIYNKLLFYTNKNWFETQYYDYSTRCYCEIVIISSSVKSIAEDAFGVLKIFIVSYFRMNHHLKRFNLMHSLVAKVSKI